jgi:predicted GNAT family N-acyltransferase
MTQQQQHAYCVVAVQEWGEAYVLPLTSVQDVGPVLVATHYRGEGYSLNQLQDAIEYAQQQSAGQENVSFPNRMTPVPVYYVSEQDA